MKLMFYFTYLTQPTYTFKTDLSCSSVQPELLNSVRIASALLYIFYIKLEKASSNISVNKSLVLDIYKDMNI